jgi:fructose/tagatose bisphosphate aldolase
MVNCTVATYEECRHAFACAKDTGEMLELKLPEGAVHYMGLLYIALMLKEAASSAPAVSYRFICDCGDDASLVQEALRLGFSPVTFSGSEEVFRKLSSIATHYRAELMHHHTLA